MTDTTGKILWHSNAMHAPTGYGNQTGLFVPLLNKTYGQAIVSAFYGIQGARMTIEGIEHIPSFGDAYGNMSIMGHFHSTKSDLVIGLLDPIVQDRDVWGQFPWCQWVPIDSTPAAPGYVRSIQAARWVWSMSKFGHKMLTDPKHGLENVTYVPHGIDTETFKPMDRREARDYLASITGANLDDKFILVCVAANKGNPSRKNFDGMFEAFSAFAQKHDDAILYVHTDWHPTQGEDLRALVQFWGIEDKVYFAPSYAYMNNAFSGELLNRIYNAADAFILLSLGEGFGIPIVEAQSAGTPVILTNGTSMTELCFSGELVEAIPQKAVDGYRFPARWMYPLPPLAMQAMEKAYVQRYNEQKRLDARKGALPYHYETVFNEYMKPAVDKMLAELAQEKADVTKKRDARRERKRLAREKAKLNGKVVEKVSA